MRSSDSNRPPSWMGRGPFPALGSARGGRGDSFRLCSPAWVSEHPAWVCAPPPLPAPWPSPSRPPGSLRRGHDEGATAAGHGAGRGLTLRRAPRRVSLVRCSFPRACGEGSGVHPVRLPARVSGFCCPGCGQAGRAQLRSFFEPPVLGFTGGSPIPMIHWQAVGISLPIPPPSAEF